MTAPKKAKAPLRPLSKAGQAQVIAELSEQERAEAVAKALADVGTITASITLTGWRRGLEITLSVPADD